MSQGHEPVQEHAPEVAYEPRDVAWRRVLLIFTSIAAVLIVMHVIVTYMFNVLASTTKYTTEPFGKPARHMAQQLQDLRHKEDEILTSYGWVSREERTVRIPIERAMDLIVEEYEKESP